MFELTLVQKVMLGGLGLAHLWFFVWIWKSSPSHNWKSKGFGFNWKKRKDSPSNLDYTPAEGYFDHIQETKKRFGGKWFSNR